MPIGADVYYGDSSGTKKIDFNAMRNKDVEFVIIKAGQNVWVDTDFMYNWKAAKDAGIPRGSYFFYDSRANPITQADLWVNIMGGDFGELPMFFDLEDSYGGAFGGSSNWKLFLERVKSLVGGHEIGLYTSFYYFEDNVPEADKAYFTQYPLWIAAYNNSASPIIPPPYTNWLFWQYTDSEDGYAYGTQSVHLDMNRFNGDTATFRARFSLSGSVPVEQGELHSQPFSEVQYHRVKRFNSWCHIAVIKGGKFSVTKFGLKKVSDVGKTLKAQVVINGGDFSALHATGLHVVDGIQYRLQSEYEPFINFTNTQVSQINAFDSKNSKWNAIAGKRFIVIDGKVSTLNSAAWYEVHPRTLVGVGFNGETILCVVDGRQSPYSSGVNLFDGAAIMVEFGAKLAIDLDGGGSSAMWLKDKIVNSPIENGVPGLERYVGDHIVWFSSDEQPIITGDKKMYEVLVGVKPRVKPSMYEMVTKPNLLVGTRFESLQTVTINDASRADNGTTWLQMSDLYWIPLAYKSVLYAKEVYVSPTPSPVGTIITRKLEIDTATGKIRVDGGAWI